MKKLILALTSILFLLSCKDDTKCPLSTIPIDKGTYEKIDINTRKFNGSLEPVISSTIKKIGTIGAKAALSTELETVSEEYISGTIKLDPDYVKRYNGLVEAICGNYGFLNDGNLSKKALKEIDSIIVIQLLDFQEFVLHYPSQSKPERETRKSDPVVPVHIEDMTIKQDAESKQNKTRFESAEKYLLRNQLYLENGNAVSGVKVWCENCLGQNFAYTNDRGEFELEIYCHSKGNPTFRVQICFQYSTFQKCVFVNPDYISSLKVPLIKI